MMLVGSCIFFGMRRGEDAWELFCEITKTDIDIKRKKLKSIAENHVSSLATIPIAWCIANPGVNVCLLGASKSNQLDDTIKDVESYKKIGNFFLN